MTIYFKTGGVQKPVTRPYIKRGGVWQPAKEAYRKTGGVYASVFKYDVVPPTRPEIDLRIGGNRYIKVGIRTTGSQPDPAVALIRVMVTNYAPGPYSQFGVGYVSTPDGASGYRNEPWSDWYYNGYSGSSNHGPTNVVTEKYYPPNTNSTTNLPGGKYYYFTAWAMDFEGNWSAGTFSKVWMPKDGVAAPRIIYNVATPQATKSGYLGFGGDDFHEGRVMARSSPRANGIWYLGYGLNNSIGSRGTPTVKSATIRVARTSDDGGQPTANVRLFWHSKVLGETLTSADMHDVTVVGTINKGEVKWFNLPADWRPLLNTQIQGFGLRYGDSASDYLVATSVAEDIHSGEVHVIWEESY